MIRVGVDGGQSSIRLQIAGTATTVTVQGLGRLEHDQVGSLVERVCDAWERARESADPIDLVVLGLTTLPDSPAGRDALAAALATALPAREVWVTGDAVTAHAGAFPDSHGVSLTVGTGVACLGFHASSGSLTQVDGDGFLLGDAGGAFWIGSRGIGAVLRERDGRGAATALSAACDARYGSHRDLAAYVHSLPRAVDAIAQFAMDVQGLATDPVACDIVAAAADELMTAASAAAAPWLGHGVPIALSGRVVGQGTALRNALLPKLAAAGFDLCDAAGSPLDGALRIASRADAAPYDQLVTRWRRPR
jgi:glucosamine kinase